MGSNLGQRANEATSGVHLASLLVLQGNKANEETVLARTVQKQLLPATRCGHGDTGPWTALTCYGAPAGPSSLHGHRQFPCILGCVKCYFQRIL